MIRGGGGGGNLLAAALDRAAAPRALALRPALLALVKVLIRRIVPVAPAPKTAASPQRHLSAPSAPHFGTSTWEGGHGPRGSAHPSSSAASQSQSASRSLASRSLARRNIRKAVSYSYSQRKTSSPADSMAENSRGLTTCAGRNRKATSFTSVWLPRNTSREPWWGCQQGRGGSGGWGDVSDGAVCDIGG